MRLHRSYNKLVHRAHAYLSRRRAAGAWESYLPERIYDPRLWLWEQKSVARGAGWGAGLAIAPIPLQSLAAILACLWKRGNVPIGMLSCWISFPGYQVFAWPLQWALGALILRLVTPWSSGATLGNMYAAVSHWQQGWEGVFGQLRGISPTLFVVEFLLGCLLSSVALGYICYGIVVALPRRVFSD